MDPSLTLRLHSPLRPLLLLALIVLLLTSLAGAQERTPESSLRQEIEALRAEIGADAAPESSERAGLEAAVKWLDAAAEFLAEAARRDREAAEAPAQVAASEAELARPPAEARIEVPPGATVDDLEDLRRQAEAELGVAVKREEELERESVFRTERRPELLDLQAEVRARVGELAEDLEAAPAGAALEGRIRRIQLRAELEAARAQLLSLEAEARSYDARTNLLPKRRQRAQRRVTELRAIVNLWTRAVTAARDAEVQRARAEAEALERAAAAQHPRIRGIVAETRALLEREQGEGGLIQTLSDVQAREHELSQQLERIEGAFSNTRRKLEVAGLSDPMGRVLREQLEDLPRTAELESVARDVRRELGEVQFEGLEMAERKHAVYDVEVLRVELDEALAAEASGPRLATLREAGAAALTQRKEAVARVVDLLRSYETTLERVQELQRSLVGVTARYREFLERNVLFVRSIEGARLPSPGDALDAAAALTTAPRWSEVAERVQLESRATQVIAGILGILALALGAFVRRVGRELRELGERARRFRTDSFRLTLEASAWTLLRALPLPLALWTVGWLLGRSGVEGAGTTELAAGARSLAVALYALLLLAALLRPLGLADVHFRWPSQALQALRRDLRWFAPLFAIAWGLASAFRAHAEPRFESSLGRLGFLVAMLGLAVTTRRALHKDGPVLRSLLERDEGLIARTYLGWSSLLMAFPVALVVASLVGYHYTALRFADTWLATLVWLGVLLLARALASRWQFLARRRLAVEQAQARARARSEETSDEGGFDEEHVDIPAVDAQTRRLFNGLTALGLLAGLYLIWSSLLPALGGLERVQVWPEWRVVEERAVSEATLGTGGADGMASAATAEEESGKALPKSPAATLMASAQDGAAREVATISLADVIAALLILLVTTLLAQNVPGLLEIGVLQRLPLDAGARYGFSSILRYAILIVGITAGLGAIGIGWSTVQWLAAALTFGLAFGLQEIFANFVSGLILLLERPIRVGDVVIIDDIEGKVSRIRMRATTITDWNRRELLVPNKQFITDKVVNLTLTDPVTRIVVPVGIAYGSDVRQAREQLLGVARRCAGVLEDPPPSVVFREFGDSALILHLRAFIPTFDVWLEVMNELHLGIDDAFREAGIEISFPQRDLHLRSVDEGVRERLWREPGGSPGGSPGGED